MRPTHLQGGPKNWNRFAQSEKCVPLFDASLKLDARIDEYQSVFVNKSAVSLFPCLRTLTSIKFTFFVDHSAVNFIESCASLKNYKITQFILPMLPN